MHYLYVVVVLCWTHTFQIQLLPKGKNQALYLFHIECPICSELYHIMEIKSVAKLFYVDFNSFFSQTGLL